MMAHSFESNFATEIGRVQAIFTGTKTSTDTQDAFVAQTLGPYSTTEHLKRVKARGSVVLAWHEILLACIRGVHKLAPTICARHTFITQVAVYDAWAAYKSNVRAVYFKGEKVKATKVAQADSMENTISFAAFATLSILFQTARLRDGKPDEAPEKVPVQHATSHLKAYLQTRYPNANLEALKVETTIDLDTAIENTNHALDESMLLGLRVARDVLSERLADGANQDGKYTDQVTDYPRNVRPPIIPLPNSRYPNEPLKVKDFDIASGEIYNPDFWQQLDVEGNYPTVQEPATPHWGKVKAFASDGWSTADTDQMLVDGKFPDYAPGNSSGYKAIVDEVLAYSAALNDKNKVIADYWADYNHSNLPPGHWCVLTVRLMYERKYSTDQAVQLLFVLTAALFDASIACWSGKYKFNKPRPITAANKYPEDYECVYTFQNGPLIQIAQNKYWRPYQPKALISPNFPAYPSGHSTFGAAFVTVMKKFTGSELFRALVMIPKQSLPSDSSYNIMAPAANTTLYWETFEEASQENGISRLYNGVHYQPDNVHGMEVGRAVGSKVWDVAFSYFEAAYKMPSQVAPDVHSEDSRDNDGGGKDVSVNGKQSVIQSVMQSAGKIGQTFSGRPEQASS